MSKYYIKHLDETVDDAINKHHNAFKSLVKARREGIELDEFPFHIIDVEGSIVEEVDYEDIDTVEELLFEDD